MQAKETHGAGCRGQGPFSAICKLIFLFTKALGAAVLGTSDRLQLESCR